MTATTPTVTNIHSRHDVAEWLDEDPSESDVLKVARQLTIQARAMDDAQGALLAYLVALRGMPEGSEIDPAEYEPATPTGEALFAGA